MPKIEHPPFERVLHIDLIRNTMKWSIADKSEETLHETKARAGETADNPELGVKGTDER